ncbi:hypothetical protein JCM19301_3668 [Jejuia pallidilutea]|uniref:Uncharacterized protein n=1 Tax=Jejuia pallidilutea TaxID=504487 RepID=A0A090VMF1_9FLAO|nr:hypothetical protein JCM19301_3668 [Jejuia pallidilutea]GAL69259.1 hypothetical protein JCM19302_3988 [Jejuia pallidilutea]
MFYTRLLESEDFEALTTYYVLLKHKNEPISEQLKAKTLLNEDAQYKLIAKLKKHKLLNEKETAIVDLKTYAKSKLFANSYFKDADNTIEFVEEQTFKTDNNTSIRLFLFKRTDKRQPEENQFLHAIAFEDTKGKTYKLTPYFIGLKNGISISGYKTEKDVTEDIVLQIKHKTRKRIKVNMY